MTLVILSLLHYISVAMNEAIATITKRILLFVIKIDNKEYPRIKVAKTTSMDIDSSNNIGYVLLMQPFYIKGNNFSCVTSWSYFF